jgi:hypothetical protein
MMGSPLRIDYEQLVGTYLEGLTTVLRGFNAAEGIEFLDSWVPDDDALMGIQSIVEAARDSGMGELLIHVGPDTLQTVELSRLRELASRVGTVHVEVNGEGIDLLVSSIDASARPDDTASEPRARDEAEPRSPSAASQTITIEETAIRVWADSDSGVPHSAYRRGLQEALQHCTHEGGLEAESGLELVEARNGGVVLRALVYPADHTVRKVRYQGAVSQVQRGLLERLSGLLEGKPIQECADHAAIHLEYRLRDHSQPSPVPGIVLPQNVGSMFSLPLQLVRGLLADYRGQRDFWETENFYTPPMSAEWRQLSRAKRMERLQAATARHPLGSQVTVARLEGAQGVVAELNGASHGRNRGGQLMELETYLKDTVEPTLQVFLEPKVDQNKLRRISGSELD